MRNEVQHISNNHAALKWALGCVFASYRERLRTMIARNPRISRWVLVLEMLVCFTPLTWLCLATFANLSRMEGKTGIVALTVAAAGPIGLVVAFKVVVLNRPSLTKLAMAALCILAAWTGLTYSLQLLAEPEPASHWREFVLIALLPALGIAHLLYLASRPRNELAAT
jgi:TRAP-type C4-dicarboxylate transport system permease small subunit